MPTVPARFGVDPGSAQRISRKRGRINGRTHAVFDRQASAVGLGIGEVSSTHLALERHCLTTSRAIFISVVHADTAPRPPFAADLSCQLDYEAIEGGRVVGRMYEDKHALPELRWFWSMTIFVGYRPDVVTNGRTPSLEDAKVRF